MTLYLPVTFGSQNHLKKNMKGFAALNYMGYTITPKNLLKMKENVVFFEGNDYLPSSPTTQKHFNLTGLLKHDDSVTSTSCMMLDIP